MGIIIIAASSVIGWAGLIGLGALSLRYGVFWAKAGAVVYAVSWVMFGIGVLLSGRDGIIYLKRFVKGIKICGR